MARPGPGAIVVTATDALARWLASRPQDELGEPFTFVVGLDGQLHLAPQRSEHVDCAAGQPVLAAGEVLFMQDGSAGRSARSATSRPVTVLTWIPGRQSPWRWTVSA
jgi:hypothetical protein